MVLLKVESWKRKRITWRAARTNYYKVWETKSILVHSSFTDNIWGTDVADMQLLSKFNEGVCFILCLIDSYSKYFWVIRLIEEKLLIAIINAFQKILDISEHKPNKIWVDKDSEFTID